MLLERKEYIQRTILKDAVTRMCLGAHTEREEENAEALRCMWPKLVSKTMALPKVERL